jgi:hypothetical protein
MINSECHEAHTYAVFVRLMSLLPSSACSTISSVYFLVLGQGLANFLETGRKVNIFSLRCTTGRGKMEDT